MFNLHLIFFNFLEIDYYYFIEFIFLPFHSSFNCNFVSYMFILFHLNKDYQNIYQQNYHSVI